MEILDQAKHLSINKCQKTHVVQQSSLQKHAKIDVMRDKYKTERREE